MKNFEILKNIYICSNGLIFDENGLIIKVHKDHEFIYKSAKKNLSDYKIINLLENEYVDLTHYYNHWPFAHRYDCLSRLRHLEQIKNENTNFIIGIPQGYIGSQRFELECKLFGINKKIYYSNNSFTFKVKSLIYPFWLIGENPCHFTNDSFLFCRSKYENYFTNNNTKYKLFLSRLNYRKILNYSEVHEFFEKNGFIIINGSEDLESIINYFFNAEIIIGVHGGLFSNLIFCDNLKKVIEIFPENYYNGCYYGWKDIIKIKLYETIIVPSENIDIVLSQQIMNKLVSL
ncbi:glycosyltransferase family 61 protein [Candidatus Gracilibacteria bacterium]|jgi:hypothetical protein|nr:glycosyltransferase family 61 protein [Candidatus Gracilibacteria bacterium]